jgi:hypothetical protein
MTMSTGKELSIVFVGCGGTFWTAHPYFSSLLRVLSPNWVYYVDPDKLTRENTVRQWCNSEDLVGVSKAKCAGKLLTWPSGPIYDACVQRFEEWARDTNTQRVLETSEVLVIVNVDNDDARLAVRTWCLEHPQRAVMVMSGCDLNYGQVYYGVYDRNEAIHDWLPLHPDVGNREAPIQHAGMGCGAQSTLSNMVTGALFAPAIEEAIRWFRTDCDLEDVGEWYWRLAEGVTKAWTSRAALYTEVVDG